MIKGVYPKFPYFRKSNFIANRVEEQEENKDNNKPNWAWQTRWRENITEDESAPEFYSQMVIYVFSIVFCVLFGAFLLVANIGKTNAKKVSWEVLLFSILYTSTQFLILSAIQLNAGIALVFNFIGGQILNIYFWDKGLGKETKYRAKSYAAPLIIGIVLSVVALLGFIYGDPSVYKH
jgi:hypothetical protein